jgi:hypothetical protein
MPVGRAFTPQSAKAISKLVLNISHFKGTGTTGHDFATYSGANCRHCVNGGTSSKDCYRNITASASQRAYGAKEQYHLVEDSDF